MHKTSTIYVRCLVSDINGAVLKLGMAYNYSVIFWNVHWVSFYDHRSVSFCLRLPFMKEKN